MLQEKEQKKNDEPLKFNKEDFLFILRCLAQNLPDLIKYTLIGAATGYVTAYLCSSDLNRFAREHHHAIDPSDRYVDDEVQFLHASRDSKFNKITPPISHALPFYVTGLGASSGFIYGLFSSYNKLRQQLEEKGTLQDQQKSLVRASL